MNVITPSANEIKSKSWVTYRRLWLDTILDAFMAEMRGAVLDVGGKHSNKRGGFIPPEETALAWWYFNLDLSAQPDIFADVGSLPLKDECMNVVICTEVLEHLAVPAACAREIHRILQKDGIAFFSVPFMYPVHGDPFDYQRYTADGLRNLFCAISTVSIQSMGGYLGTMVMVMEIGLPGISGQQISRRLLRRGLSWLANRFYLADLKLSVHQPAHWSKFTTGYFVRVVKRPDENGINAPTEETL
jgi:SAM-dependent methyltransferase